jgi:hypothetical protein
MTDSAGVAHKMYLVRNPWGITKYNSTWSANDTNWTDSLAAQVPLGVDPRRDYNKGLFTIPYTHIIDEKCVSSFQIAHLRDKEGYNKTWFDEEIVPRETVYNYYEVTIPSTVPANSYLYFTVETQNS